MNNKGLYLLLCLGFVLGISGCGDSNSISNSDSSSSSDEKIVVDNPDSVILDNFINENTYLEIARFSYMNENAHILRNKSSRISKSLPGGSKNKLYPGDIQKLIKQNNLFEVSSELMSDNFVKELNIENKSSKISVVVDRDSGIVVVSLFRADVLVESRELNFELFADSAVDRYYEEK